MALKLKGNKALLRRLENLNKEGKELVRGRVEQSLNNIRNEAIARAPHNTGFLIGSIAVGLNRETKGMGGVVVANAKYAPYIEFGTGAKVNVPQGLEAYASQFKGKGIREVNLPARPFLYPAWFKESKELMIKLEKGLSQIVKK